MTPIQQKKLLKENPRISIDPEIMGGTPTIKETRIPVVLILEMLEGRNTFQDINRQYPSLTDQDIQAAIHYSSSVLTAR